MTFSLRSFPTLNLSYPILPLPGPDLSKEEWISVLTLASKWRFAGLRARAIVVLMRSPVGPLITLEKIQLGRQLYIPSWVIDGFVELVHARTITDKEALLIDTGIDVRTTAYKLFRIREQRIAGEVRSWSNRVEEIFKEELDRLRSDEKLFTASFTK